jgi:hypothetical protein
MRQYSSIQHQLGEHERTRRQRFDRQVQAVLWAAWTLAVCAIAYLSWHADKVALRPLNWVGLVIHSSVGGVIGLVVLTVIEMRLRPWGFTE